MFHKNHSTSKKKQSAAGKKVYARFVKGKGELNKYQHHMIRDMAYFEALFNEMLNDKNAKVETLEGLKKGREAMRMSLNISPKAKTSEAVLKFWATGKMLNAAYKKNKKKKKKKEKLKNHKKYFFQKIKIFWEKNYLTKKVAKFGNSGNY